MRSRRVVGHPSALDGALCISERAEPVLIQALVPQPAVEGLDEGIVHGFPGTAELDLHAVLMRPRVECLAPELGAVVHGDALWPPARDVQPLEDGHDARTARAHIDFDHRALARTRINEGQRTTRAAVSPRVP